MIDQHITERLSQVDLSFAFEESLRMLAEHDDITGMRNWGLVVPTVAAALEVPDPAMVQPFAIAWGLLMAALRRIDHLQDGDPDDTALLSYISASEHHNLLLAYYLLAHAFLDDLDPAVIPPDRLLRLRRVWTDCLLLVANGQQQDLDVHRGKRHIRAPLDQYEYVVQTKTSPLLALAFSGPAILLTDEKTTIDVLFEVGSIYGMLVQYSDDLADVAAQPKAALTLPRAYEASWAHYPDVTLPNIGAFWHFVYRSYIQRVEQALTVLPEVAQSTIIKLFTSTFEQR